MMASFIIQKNTMFVTEQSTNSQSDQPHAYDAQTKVVMTKLEVWVKLAD